MVLGVGPVVSSGRSLAPQTREESTVTRQRDPFAAAEQYAHEWLAVARRLTTDDRSYAYRALRDVTSIAVQDASAAVAAVSRPLRDLVATGHLDHALVRLAGPVRALLAGEPAPGSSTGELTARLESLTDRVDHLEATVDRLVEAVGVLASGLERVPVDEPTTDRAAGAAHTAHRILLAGDAGTY